MSNPERFDESLFAAVPSVEFVFASEASVYYKNESMRSLDRNLGDIKFQATLSF